MIKLADLDVAVLGFGYLKTLNHWIVYRVTDRGRAVVKTFEQQVVAEIHAKTRAAKERVKYLGDITATPLPFPGAN